MKPESLDLKRFSSHYLSTHLKIIPVYTNTFWSRNILDKNWRKGYIIHLKYNTLRSQLKKFHSWT